jgi:hypothetical protein
VEDTACVLKREGNLCCLIIGQLESRGHEADLARDEDASVGLASAMESA